MSVLRSPSGDFIFTDDHLEPPDDPAIDEAPHALLDDPKAEDWDDERWDGLS